MEKILDTNYDKVKTIIENESGMIYERCGYCPTHSNKFISIEGYPIVFSECKKPIKRFVFLNWALANGYSIHSYLEEDEYFYFNGSSLSIKKKISGNLITYLATNSEPTKENLINGIESVPFAYVVNEDRFVPINKNDMDKKVTDFAFLTRGGLINT